MTGSSPKRVRCAIYTRKSSEEGLEQSFNSLDAQREACEAFVRSQRHEGWVLLPSRYDDGGFSGGTIERPALQKLLADVTARRVDTIVVYKVDRLTRALSDFAKIVEILDAQGVSFVSVTQQFNTTTSMGRLTLNMLLSFAQFEREVTGERIRDKIAASKAKGMWMGGFVPLGYDAKDRTLVINEAEAKTVRKIFELYLAHGNVRKLKEAADRLGLTTKPRTNSSAPGSRPFSRGHLYKLLSNPIYAGQIAHRGQLHPGLHPPLIEPEVWDRVQAQLSDNLQGHRSRVTAAQPSLLAGKLFDAAGDRLTPSHANKKGRRYRYYISQRLIQGGGAAQGRMRIPAAEIESAVARALKDALLDGLRLLVFMGAETLKPTAIKQCLARARAVVGTLGKSGKEDAAQWASLIERVVVAESELFISLSPAGLAEVLAIDGPESNTTDHDHTITVPIKLTRRGVVTKLIVGGSNPTLAGPDPAILKLVTRAFEWFDRLIDGRATGLGEIAQKERVGTPYVARVLHVACLAPDIVEAVLDGRQPADLTAQRLLNSLPLPLRWADQRRALGFQ
jgi:DNA invertase Pin-like site-specific DNA recombinase